MAIFFCSSRLLGDSTIEDGGVSCSALPRNYGSEISVNMHFHWIAI